MQEPIVSPSSPARKLFTPSGSQGTKGLRVFEGRHSPLGYHPKIVPIISDMPHFILFSRDIALLSLVFQCCMDYNKFIFFFHYTPHMHALWIVPSAQCQFACKQLTNINKQTNKSLQQMSDTDSEMNGVTNAMEAAEIQIAGEFKLRALNNNKLFYFSKIIIQKTQLCAARRFRQCAIIDNTNFMTCTLSIPIITLTYP